MAWFDDLNLPGSTITGRFAWVRGDGPDADEHPDITRATGSVTFTPTADAVRTDGAWIGIEPVTAIVYDGELVASEEYQGPVRLLSTDADTGVEGWGWVASFDIEGASIKPIRFHAPAEGVRLTGDDLIPITGLPVEIIGKGAMDRLEEVESTVTAHASALDGKVDTTDPRLSDARPPTTHQHPVSDVDGLAARLAALEYDSGWRVLTSWDASGTRVGNWTFPSGVAPTPGASGSVRIRRVGRRVEWLFYGCSWSSSAVLFQSEIPAGFRNGDTEWIAPVVVGLTPTDLGTFRRRKWGFYINDASGKTSHTTYGTHFGYETNEPIPTTLPGDPA